MSMQKTYVLNFFIVMGLLLISVYLQLFDGLVPCPLCTLQRFTLVVLGVLFLLGLCFGFLRWGRYLVNTFISLTSLMGIFLSGRQIWLQHFPSASSAECGVSLQYMIQVLPFTEVMQRVFAGSAECTQTGWSFLYLDMAEWALVWFGIFFMIGIILLYKEWNKKPSSR